MLHYNAISHEELYPVIERAKGIVLPSLIDNLPNTCLEAMALGQIVIGTYGTSFEQLIENEQSGFLCEPGNSNNLLDTCKKILSLSTERKSIISRNARKRIDALNPEKKCQELVWYIKKIKNKKCK